MNAGIIKLVPKSTTLHSSPVAISMQIFNFLLSQLHTCHEAVLVLLVIGMNVPENGNVPYDNLRNGYPLVAMNRSRNKYPKSIFIVDANNQ